MSKNAESNSRETARVRRRRRRVAFFFAAWTALAALCVWWLLRRADPGTGTSWVIKGDGLAKASFADQAGNWFKLVDLNFHGIYPWVLLAPYVVWLGSRFHLERRQWRVSLPAHLAGCAAFAVALHTLNSHTGWSRQVIVRFTTEKTASAEGKGEAGGKVVRTNEFKIITRGRLPQLPDLPAELEAPPAQDGAFPSAGAVGRVAGTADEAVPGDGGNHSSFYWMQRASPSLSDLLGVMAYASLVGIAQAFHFNRRSKERERRAAALEAQLTEARLNALQARLHPHFLFNALNAISTLLRRDTRAAQDALSSFSDLLRLALNQSTQPEVLLCEDLRFLRRYVQIQQMRLGERLNVEEVIDEGVMDCLVPALLLQPLVENAIRHGIEPSASAGFVRVAVRAEGENLVLTIEDNGVGLSPVKPDQSGAGAGIGLQNLRAHGVPLWN